MSMNTNKINCDNISISGKNLFSQLDDIPDQKNEYQFSYRDIANDILIAKNKIFTNSIILKYFSEDQTNTSPTALGNVVLRNICRNIVNDPNNPPPNNYIKRITLISSRGNPFIDAMTYKNDGKSFLNLDRNICQARLDSSVIEFEDIFNPFDIELSDNTIVKDNAQTILVLSDKEYVYPANEEDENYLVSNKIQKSEMKEISLSPNYGGRKEVIQSICKDWGWSTRRTSLDFSRAYYVAHNIETPSGFSFVIRISYINYKNVPMIFKIPNLLST